MRVGYDVARQYLNQLLVLYPLVEEFFERGEFDKIFTNLKIILGCLEFEVEFDVA